jgi:PhnB protein
MKTVAYLHFQDSCEEAFGAYAGILDGKIETMMRFKDMPADQRSPGREEKVVHAHLVAPGCELMGSDPPPNYFQKPQGFAVSLHVDQPAEAERLFNALAEGGQVTMPLGKTFWAERFGMLTDRFGIPWMIDCPPAAG